ncbi:unnamed protein product [Rotaria sp. Silwood1]|nr:unnamed protein product [Rotaria sp. Silwood1]CAF3443032.1 unnamed protein product [Rotaria sp. Silwood1]
MDRRFDHILEICRKISRCPGVHSVIAMQAAGFVYTNVGDTVRCDDCQLEVSDWTNTMVPFTIHAERSPNCAFIRSVRQSNEVVPLSLFTSPITSLSGINIESTDEHISENQQLDETEVELDPLKFANSEAVEQSRRQTFLGGAPECPSCLERMIKAGFFSCNIDDRVICLYCNLICHQWVPHSDDPCEVHQTLSPTCPFVKNMLIRHQAASTLIINNNSMANRTADAASTNTYCSNEIVPILPLNTAYADIPKRVASFATWSNGALPTVDEFVRAGFFYTRTGSIVSCFYCHGRLNNWNDSHNPMIEHARWFPHCAYAKQLCGDTLHRTIQESTRDTQRSRRASNSIRNNTIDGQKLDIPDEKTLSHLVTLRLNWPMSKKLLAQKFHVSIIKLCWENQLRLKQLDFKSESDLLVACIILQRQRIHIDKRKEHIIIPAERMNQIHKRQQQLGVHAAVLPIPTQVTAPPTNAFNTTDIGTGVSPESSTDQAIPRELTPATLCMVCISEERCLAFIPCGHMGTCLACRHSLSSCRICGQNIEAFVRIYVS